MPVDARQPDNSVPATPAPVVPAGTDSWGVKVKKYVHVIWLIITLVASLAGYSANEFMGPPQPRTAPVVEDKTDTILKKIDGLQIHIDTKFGSVRVTPLDE